MMGDKTVIQEDYAESAEYQHKVPTYISHISR